MKLKGLVEFIILIVVCVFIYNAYGTKTDTNNLIANSNVYDLSNKSISDKTIIYKNRELHPVTLSNNNIKIVCKGKSTEDEELVRNNMLVKTLFRTEDNKAYNTITLNSGDTVYIEVTDEYIGSTLPLNEVKCNYQVNVSVQ